PSWGHAPAPEPAPAPEWGQQPAAASAAAPTWDAQPAAQQGAPTWDSQPSAPAEPSWDASPAPAAEPSWDATAVPAPEPPPIAPPPPPQAPASVPPGGLASTVIAWPQGTGPGEPHNGAQGGDEAATSIMPAWQPPQAAANKETLALHSVTADQVAQEAPA